MLSDMPDPDRKTCLVLEAAESNRGKSLWIARLRKNGTLAAQQETINLDDAGRIPAIDSSDAIARRLLKLLGGYQVVHFDQYRCIDAIEDVLDRADFLPLDNPVFDIAPLARRRIAGDASLALSLGDVFQRAGGVLPAASGATRSAPEAGRILCEIYAKLVVPSLGVHASLGDRARRRTVSRDPVGLSTHGIVLPMPDIPRRDPPTGGWRTTPWCPLEAEDVARRFADGADLIALSSLTSRSPRAIVARLQRDGVLQRS